jgi:hypothetical protein
MKQDELGRVLRQMVPPVDETGVWADIASRAKGAHRVEAGDTPKRSRRRVARRLAVAGIVVVVLVALGFGVRGLLEQLRQDRVVLVITDDSITSDTAAQVGDGSSDQTTTTTNNAAANRRWTVAQITDNEVMDEVPVAQGHLMVWRAYDGHDYEIMAFDFTTGATTQLTDNQVDDWEPKVYGNHVVWMEGAPGGPWNLRLYDADRHTADEVPDSTVRYGQYELKGDLLVWPQVQDGSSDVKVLRLSTGKTLTIDSWGPEVKNVFARTDGRYVLVAAESQQDSWDLLLYDTVTNTQKKIASGAIADDWRYLDDRRLADGAVVWSASDGHDNEIFLYDIASGTTTQLTHNEVSDTEPEVGRGYVLWAQSPLQEDASSSATREVILYDRRSTHEQTLGQGYGRLAEDGTLVVWSEYPQKAKDVWVYDTDRAEATYLADTGSQASWPDVVEGRVVWYRELEGAQQPSAEVMVAMYQPITGTASAEKLTTDWLPGGETKHMYAAGGPALNWGQVATLKDRTVSVSKPIEDLEAVISLPEASPWAQMGVQPKVVYSLVTITNTGDSTLTYDASAFQIEGKSSGGNGSVGLATSLGGHTTLGRGTLLPGESAEGAVCFLLGEKDKAVKVRLEPQSGPRMVLASWR